MVVSAPPADPGGVQAEDLDDIVQRLAVARYALEADDAATATAAIEAALDVARRLMSTGAGADFVRSRPAV
ncbi:MAG: hypothetical protein QOJ03_2420 [Frankiaceae bacterium]|jgi:hypothetical protein|nr:hypothetical protein [Frankiaceae bacterium]